MTDTVAKLVYYSGRVQGVGFRYTTLRVADRFDVVGYVKNLPDGRVEMFAQGHADVVHDFMDTLKAEMAMYIRDVHVADQSPIATYTDFRVAY